MLVTARHVLYGHEDDEHPLTKYVWFNGDLRQLSKLRFKTVLHDRNNDLAAIYADELGLPRCLAMFCLSPTEAICEGEAGPRDQTGRASPHTMIGPMKRLALGQAERGTDDPASG
jgi:hypothetical protein